jgi:hypothetical protein
MVNLVIWIALHQCDDFIETPLAEEELPACSARHRKFLESGDQWYWANFVLLILSALNSRCPLTSELTARATIQTRSFLNCPT